MKSLQRWLKPWDTGQTKTRLISDTIWFALRLPLGSAPVLHCVSHWAQWVLEQSAAVALSKRAIKVVFIVTQAPGYDKNALSVNQSNSLCIRCFANPSRQCWDISRSGSGNLLVVQESQDIIKVASMLWVPWMSIQNVKAIYSLVQRLLKCGVTD